MAVLFAGLTFTGCQKNDPASLLQGKWSVYSMTMLGNGVSGEVNLEGGSYMFFTFYEDGNYARDMNMYGENEAQNGTWELTENVLILDKGTANEQAWNVKELTVSKLVIAITMDSETMQLNMNKVK